MKKHEFKVIKPSDSEIIAFLSKNSSVKSRVKNFPNFQGDIQYWIDTQAKKPHLLLVLTPIQKGVTEPLTAWIEEEGSTYSLDIIPLLSPSPDALTCFLTCFSQKCTLLAVPAVQDEASIDLLELAGFKRVGSLIKGQGFFKGTPHHVMKYRV
ncbi:MAG: hypothetical protein RLZZ453_91 [Chlamydiota bacterium]|jgi:hypothetical protein